MAAILTLSYVPIYVFVFVRYFNVLSIFQFPSLWFSQIQKFLCSLCCVTYLFKDKTDWSRVENKLLIHFPVLFCSRKIIKLFTFQAKFFGSNFLFASIFSFFHPLRYDIIAAWKKEKISLNIFVWLTNTRANSFGELLSKKKCCDGHNSTTTKAKEISYVNWKFSTSLFFSFFIFFK